MLRIILFRFFEDVKDYEWRTSLRTSIIKKKILNIDVIFLIVVCPAIS